MTVQARQEAARRERAAAERQMREAAYAEQRRQQDAAELERISRPCADCGLPESAGLCLVCTERRTTEKALGELVDLTVAFTADLADAAAVAAASERCAQDARRTLAETAERLRGEGAPEAAAVMEARFLAERLRDQQRQAAYRTLWLGETAQAEAQQAFEATWRARHRYATESLAETAARTAAEKAQARCARHLLDDRLHQLRTVRGEVPARRPATDWQQRLAEHAARPLPEEERSAVGRKGVA
ncbi:hypothetical protein GCM10020000_87530 [Streptomyces olivoverticillatus]